MSGLHFLTYHKIFNQKIFVRLTDCVLCGRCLLVFNGIRKRRIFWHIYCILWGIELFNAFVDIGIIVIWIIQNCVNSIRKEKNGLKSMRHISNIFIFLINNKIIPLINIITLKVRAYISIGPLLTTNVWYCHLDKLIKWFLLFWRVSRPSHTISDLPFKTTKAIELS